MVWKSKSTFVNTWVKLDQNHLMFQLAGERTWIVTNKNLKALIQK